MTNPSKINGNHHLRYPETEAQRYERMQVALYEATKTYIETIEEATQGNFNLMMPAALSVATSLLASAFNGDRQRIADVYRKVSVEFADKIEAGIEPPEDRVVN
jgi:hypothetical protein